MTSEGGAQDPQEEAHDFGVSIPARTRRAQSGGVRRVAPSASVVTVRAARTETAAGSVAPTVAVLGTTATSSVSTASARIATTSAVARATA